MTECSETGLDLGKLFGREMVARFDGGLQSSDGGAVLLRAVDERLGMVERLAACFRDEREQGQVKHRLPSMLRQRVFGLALGYEDLDDHEQLRYDPLLQVLAGARQVKRLAGKSTLNRLELAGAEASRYKRICYEAGAIDALLVDLFVEAHAEAPEELLLDVDTTEVELHGQQEGRFFHGHYDSYCYLPLYIFCGQQVLAVRLRQANAEASEGAREELARVVARLRQYWPQVRITVRADSGFCREELMHWCEQEQVEYVFGLAGNTRLLERIGAEMALAAERHADSGQPERVFAEFNYATRHTWSRERRVIAKAEHIEGKANPRFLATSLTGPSWQPRALYEDLYCARGDMENRIKEQKALFAARASAETMRANQLRMYLSTFAYILMHGLRRLALTGTSMARAQVPTIRLRLLKIGARLRITARRIWISLPSSYPWQDIFRHTVAVLRC